MRTVWLCVITALPAFSCAVARAATTSLSPQAWVIENEALRVSVSPADLCLSVTDKRAKVTWQSQPLADGDLFVRVNGKDERPSLSAARRSAMRTPDGFTVTVASLAPSRSSLGIRFGLAGTDLTVRLKPRDVGLEDAIASVRYPSPFTLHRRSTEYAVMPLMQGVLLPGRYSRAWHFRQPFNGAWLTMPWYGAVRDQAGYVALLNSRWDAALEIDNPLGGPPTVDLVWETSHRTLRYPREVRLTFLPQANYVTLAKAYRAHVETLPEYRRKLADRIRELPSVAELSKSFWLDVALMEHIERQNDTPIHIASANFDQRAAQLRFMRQAGMSHLVTRLMGWEISGFAAYSPLHLPPCLDIGGAEGLKRLSDACQEIGYTLGLHFNFWPMAERTPAFDAKKAMVEASGSPYRWWGEGGWTYALCGKYYIGFQQQAFDGLQQLGIKVGSYYLDQYDAVQPLEDFSSDHPATREQDVAYRIGALQSARARGVPVTSEYGGDWAVPYLDQIFRVPPTEVHEGIRVPLYNIVNGDRLIIRQATGNPEEILYCLGYGFAPRDGMSRTSRPDYPPNDQAAEWKLWTDIYADHPADAVADHKFLSSDFQQFETTFASGRRVRINLTERTYQLLGLKSFDAQVHQLPEPGLSIAVEVLDFKYLGGRKFQFRLRYTYSGDKPLEPNLYPTVYLVHTNNTQGEKIVTGRSELFAVPSDQWKKGLMVEGRVMEWELPEPWGPGDYDLTIFLFRRGETNKHSLVGPRSAVNGLRCLGTLVVRGYKEIAEMELQPPKAAQAPREAGEALELGDMRL